MKTQNPQNPYISCIVQASAGSGKTYQLSRRFLYLIAAGAKPSSVLTITFTKKAAQEMRARIIKEACNDVLDTLGIEDPVLDIAKKLEKVALDDEYFVERSLYPNVDFYSGIIYRALGIPPEMFTVMFSLGRLPGWIAQWKEMLDSKDPIGRPRQIYTGKTARDYVPVDER